MLFSLITCFATGMLISVSLCHILPEANEMYADHLKAAHKAEEKAELAAGGEKNKLDQDEEEEEGEHKNEEHGEHEGHGEEGGHGFPLPNVLFFAGFMSMLLIDRVLFKEKLEKVDVKQENVNVN